MLRLAVIVLLLANAGYYAWSQGLLKDWGFAPEEQAEPQRMNQQIRPETLQILRVNPSRTAPSSSSQSAPSGVAVASSNASSAPSSPSASDAAECLQAGVFDERQAEALRATLAPLPQGSWQLDPTPIPGRWMVYMGKFADADALAKKRAELRELGISFDRPSTASLEPGLSLGRFSTEEAAQRGLGNLVAKGVRTAKVVQERPDTPGYQLRLPSVDDALRPQLDVLRPAMAGKTLKPCS